MKQKLAVRLPLTLSESTEKACPEFSYKDLLKKHSLHRLGKQSLGEVLNGPTREKDDPFVSDEDEALKALAWQLEEKYGSSNDQKKRRKRHKENDFKQLGEGYDETDPFIDNSDAIDDVLPTNVETKHGGFYINLGRLNFEEFPEEEAEKSCSSDVLTCKTIKKNQITSSDEETTEINETEVNSICENGLMASKKRKLDEGELLRQRKKMIDKFNAKKLKKPDENVKKASENLSKPAADFVDSNNKCSNGTSSVAASIEAVVIKAREKGDNRGNEERKEEKVKSDEQEEKSVVENGRVEKMEEAFRPSIGTDSLSTSPSGGGSSSSESDSEDGANEEKGGMETLVSSIGNDPRDLRSSLVSKEDEVSSGSAEDVEESPPKEKEKGKDCPLPDGLPLPLLAVIEKIKEEGKNTKTSSQKFFSESVNKLLLSIEIKLCKCGKSKRNAVFAHLSQHLPCTAQTLIKRGKNLLSEKLDERLKEPIRKLQDAIAKSMVPLLEKYREDSSKICEKNFEPSNENELSNETAGKVKLKLPKKNFEFSDELRVLLCDVIRIRCQGWHMIKKRAEPPEEHLKTFIDERVKSLWPKGWITTKKLYKESRSAHSFLTSKSLEKLTKSTTSPEENASNYNILSPVSSTASEHPVMDVDEKVKQQKGETLIHQSSIKPINSTKSQSGHSSNTDDLNTENRCNEKKKESSQNLIRTSDLESVKTVPSVSVQMTKKEVVSKDKIESQSVIRPVPVPLKSPKERLLSTPSYSPVVLESPQSFHGFESSKSPEPPSRAKQQLNFETVKKQPTSNIHSSSDGPSIREGRPPKPSLTATALPKVKSSSSSAVISRSTNIVSPQVRDDSQKASQEIEKRRLSLAEASRSNEPKLMEKACFRDDVRVIDISSDDEKAADVDRTSNVTRNKKIHNRRPVSSESNRPNNSECQNTNVLKVTTDSSGKNVSSSSDSNRNKLEKEMDHVMNELLQISKKNLKSPDGENPVPHSNAQRIPPSSQNQNSIRSPAPPKIYDNPSSIIQHALKGHPQAAHINYQKQMPFRQSSSENSQTPSHSVSHILSSQQQQQSIPLVNNQNALHSASNKSVHSSSPSETSRNLNSSVTSVPQHGKSLPASNSTYESINTSRNTSSQFNSPPSMRKVVGNSSLSSRNVNQSSVPVASNHSSSHTSHTIPSHKASSINPTGKPSSASPAMASQYTHHSWSPLPMNKSSSMPQSSCPKMSPTFHAEGKLQTTQTIPRHNSLPNAATSTSSISQSRSQTHEPVLGMNTQRSMPVNSSVSPNALVHARSQTHDLSPGMNTQRSLPANSSLSPSPHVHQPYDSNQAVNNQRSLPINSASSTLPLSRSQSHDSHSSKAFQHYPVDPRIPTSSSQTKTSVDDRGSSVRREVAQTHNSISQNRSRPPSAVGSFGSNPNLSPSPQIARSASMNPSVSNSLQQNLPLRTNRPPSSHNIEGLLYNNNVNAPVKMSSHPPPPSNPPPTHSPVSSTSSPVSSKHSYHQKQLKMAHSPSQSSSGWTDDAILSAFDSTRHNLGNTKLNHPPQSSYRQKSSDSVFSGTGDGNQETILANLRLMEGLSVSNVAVKPRSGSDSGHLAASSAPRSNNGSSTEPKQRMRYDSYQNVGSLSPTKAPNEYWKQRTNPSSSQLGASGRLPPKQ